MNLSPWQGVAQMDGAHWAPRMRPCNIERFHYVLKKVLIDVGDICLASPPPPSHYAVVMPAASLIVIMLDCCNFHAVPRQWFCGSWGNTRFSCFPTTSYRDIRLHANKLTGFHSHCQSRNLGLCVAERLSECE